jgi:riboflavin kinase/FMN adenylyltransferase
MIERLVAEASRRGCRSLVLTFWPHPRTVLQGGAGELRLLSTLEEKEQMLRSLGVDCVQVLEFDRAFASLTASEYLRRYVRDRFGGSVVLIGYDQRMGSDMPSADRLSGMAAEAGLEPVMAGKCPAEASSTLIRKALASGDMDAANSMLGYRYSLGGKVVERNRIGRTIGFPTANMELDHPFKTVPANGVYEVDVETAGGSYKGMCNIGFRPTVGDHAVPTIETNIFDFDRDIYGQDIKVSFVRKIRDEVKFRSLEALAAQLAQDKELIYKK